MDVRNKATPIQCVSLAGLLGGKEKNQISHYLLSVMETIITGIENTWVDHSPNPKKCQGSLKETSFLAIS